MLSDLKPDPPRQQFCGCIPIGGQAIHRLIASASVPSSVFSENSPWNELFHARSGSGNSRPEFRGKFFLLSLRRESAFLVPLTTMEWILELTPQSWRPAQPLWRVSLVTLIARQVKAELLAIRHGLTARGRFKARFRFRQDQVPEPIITIGIVGVVLPCSGSIVTAKALASTLTGNGGLITMPPPRASGLNTPAGIGAPSVGISQSS